VGDLGWLARGPRGTKAPLISAGLGRPSTVSSGHLETPQVLNTPDGTRLSNWDSSSQIDFASAPPPHPSYAAWYSLLDHDEVDNCWLPLPAGGCKATCIPRLGDRLAHASSRLVEPAHDPARSRVPHLCARCCPADSAAPLQTLACLPSRPFSTAPFTIYHSLHAIAHSTAFCHGSWPIGSSFGIGAFDGG
jgi:hypothetical protein